MSIISRLVNKSFSATFENDDGVREANSLFSTLFETSEGETLTAKAIYKAYQQQCLRYRPQSHYMTIAQLNQKLAIVAQYRDDVRVMADGRLLGWKLRDKPVEAVPHSEGGLTWQDGFQALKAWLVSMLTCGIQ